MKARDQIWVPRVAPHMAMTRLRVGETSGARGHCPRGYPPSRSIVIDASPTCIWLQSQEGTDQAVTASHRHGGDLDREVVHPRHLLHGAIRQDSERAPVLVVVALEAVIR